MKRYPEYSRDYTDETLNYCLDDGTPLVGGPTSLQEPAMAILTSATAGPRTRTLISGDTGPATAMSGSPDEAFGWPDKPYETQSGVAMMGVETDFENLSDGPQLTPLLKKLEISKHTNP